ncbi:HprK-related kinase B [Alloyangia pacifica]|uniref:HprK-related kinase B n=1 Tax=Alloyangia pacifica TaxID=311180 RepID=UPI001CD56277|nr:HprK-related kinase B [Alloyangia pacifica]MCA0996637.1 HprK-related kinase B [Alloyangia pacifica]
MKSARDVLDQFDLTPATLAPPFHLAVGPVRISVFCPQGPLREALVGYFAPALSGQPGDIAVHLLEGQALGDEPAWSDWAREGGKSGRKDAIFDLQGARLIRKVRSGVTFLQSPDHAIAFGPLAQNESTVINFINTQVLNACLREGWQLCHAAAVAGARRSLAIAGLSGGGKSTSILRMMDIAGTRFVSNDRVLVRGGAPAWALGIPKHPRINPGTILGNPRLQGLLSAERRAELATMPIAELWDLEEKYDLIIPEVYGPGRVCYEAPLTDFWVLNWSRESDAPTALTPVDLADRPDLLGAIMKSPGPFYQHSGGSFEPNGAAPVPAPYLEALRDVRVFEVSGRVDFDALAAEGRALLDA